MTMPDGLAPKLPCRHEYLSDGTWRDCRWWLERLPGSDHPVLTIRHGTPGSAGHWSRVVELPGASPAAVKRKIEAMVVEEAAREAAKAARKAARLAR